MSSSQVNSFILYDLEMMCNLIFWIFGYWACCHPVSHYLMKSVRTPPVFNKIINFIEVINAGTSMQYVVCRYRIPQKNFDTGWYFTSACLSLRQPLSIDQHQPDLHSQSAWPLIPRGGSRSTLLCGGASYAEGPIPACPARLISLSLCQRGQREGCQRAQTTQQMGAEAAGWRL